MAIKKNITLSLIKKLSIFVLLFALNSEINCLSNLTPNDPFPYFTSMYPYDFLSLHERVVFEKIGTTCFDEQRWNFSVTPFYQSADNGINAYKKLAYVGDMPENINVLALFWDPFLLPQLLQVLGISDKDPNYSCLKDQLNPANSDPTKKFGFFSYPMKYKKAGFRFQFDLKIWERCFDAVGLRAQIGIANIRQSAIGPDPNGAKNLTCEALGIACPSTTKSPTSCSFIKQTAGCENPREEIIVGDTNGTAQPWKLPCCDGTCCIFSHDCTCKEYITVNVMNQWDKITQFFGIDANDFDQTSPEDLRILLWWRHIKELNSVNPEWPRILWIPFIEAGAGIPIESPRNPDKLFAVPFGNNGHASAGVTFGFAFDFIDVLEIATTGGLTKFFSEKFCGLRLPTQTRESRVYPYKADVLVEPGTNFHFTLTLNARHFIERLSVWAQYLFVAHKNDCINICRSLIPQGSDYYPTDPVNLSKLSPDLNNALNSPTLTATQKNLNRGFALKKYTDLTSWEIQMLNLGFNYDISPHVYLGFLWQHTFSRRNAYCTDTLLFSATATF